MMRLDALDKLTELAETNMDASVEDKEDGEFDFQYIDKGDSMEVINKRQVAPP